MAKHVFVTIAETEMLAEKITYTKGKNVVLTLPETHYLKYSRLATIAEYFGTTDLNCIRYTSYDGYGSEDYVWEAEVFNVTKNYPFEKAETK